MREILFRGKTSYNGEWLEGFAIFADGKAFILFDGKVVFDKAYPENKLNFMLSEVIPETVGQYTGLSDSKGRKIFEGDIVKGHLHSAWSHNIEICDIAYGKSGFESRMHINGLDSDYYSHKVLFSKDVEVIGNIHDNPELLSDEVNTDV